MPPISEDTFIERLGRRLRQAGLALGTVVLTNNRVRLASKRIKAGKHHVRVSRRLLTLGEPVVDPLVGFLLDDRVATKALRQLLGGLEPVTAKRRRQVPLRPNGRVHDLVALMRQEAFSEWGIGVELPITWGRHPPRKATRRKGARLGSYDPRGPLIRINRLLDDERVPAWYVGFVIFHEMLHHEFGIDRVDERGRRILHPPEFRTRERQHPVYPDAMKFESQTLWRLLT